MVFRPLGLPSPDRQGLVPSGWLHVLMVKFQFLDVVQFHDLHLDCKMVLGYCRSIFKTLHPGIFSSFSSNTASLKAQVDWKSNSLQISRSVDLEPERSERLLSQRLPLPSEVLLGLQEGLGSLGLNSRLSMNGVPQNGWFEREVPL